MPPDAPEKPRQELDPNFKDLGTSLPEGWTPLQEGESLRHGEIGAAWIRGAWRQITCPDEELRAGEGVVPLARKDRPVQQRALGELLQIFGACGAPYIGDLGKWSPTPKRQRPPNPEKQAAAADKRERRARRNKECV